MVVAEPQSDPLRTPQVAEAAGVAAGRDALEESRNPPGIRLRALIAEDFRAHRSSLLEPGFWAVALHRLTNWKRGIRWRALRAPLSLVCAVLYAWVRWVWGIDLPYWTRLGRRVRLWHHGGMVLGARAIGDDVQIRHNTTFGVIGLADSEGKPVIEDRVEIGVGACVLGGVRVGHDSVIGANTVVVRNVSPGTTVFGVPARPVDLKRRARVASARPEPKSGEPQDGAQRP